MYIGSVKFFKHIITLILCLFVISSVVCIVLLLAENDELKTENDELRNQIEKINGELPGADGNTPPDETADEGNDYASGSPETDNSDGAVNPAELEPSPYSHLFPDMYATSHGNAEYAEDDPDYIYLTFDDGPSSNTTSILNYLANRNVKATFFVVPNDDNAYLLSRIANEGHAIGVHTHTHKYMEIYSSVEAFMEDFYIARNIIYEETGILPDIFRFPGGSNNSYNEDVREDIITEMTRRGFVYFDWNVDSEDSNGASWDRMYRTVREDVAENRANGISSMVLFHDSPTSTYTTWVIDDLLDYFINNGYKFAKIDETVKPVQW